LFADAAGEAPAYLMSAAKLIIIFVINAVFHNFNLSDILMQTKIADYQLNLIIAIGYAYKWPDAQPLGLLFKITFLGKILLSHVDSTHHIAGP